MTWNISSDKVLSNSCAVKYRTIETDSSKSTIKKQKQRHLKYLLLPPVWLVSYKHYTNHRGVFKPLSKIYGDAFLLRCFTAKRR